MADLHTLCRDRVQQLLDGARAASPGPWQVVDPNEGSEYLPFWMVVNDAFLNPHRQPHHKSPTQTRTWQRQGA